MKFLDDLSAQAIRTVDEITFILNNFDVNSPDAVGDLDRIRSLSLSLQELEFDIRGGHQGGSELADMIAVLRLAAETMAKDAFILA